MPAGGFIQRADHRLRLLSQPLAIQAACLTQDFHSIGHDVGRLASVDNSDIGGSLLINSTQRHNRNGLRRDPDGIDTLFWSAGSVRFPPMNDGLKPILGWTLRSYPTSRPSHVEHDAVTSGQFIGIQAL